MSARALEVRDPFHRKAEDILEQPVVSEVDVKRPGGRPSCFDGTHVRRADPVRVLVVPGLHDSGPAHWQTWLQRHSRHALRVNQRDWSEPDLERWAARIEATLASQPPARWIAVGHSFGCLALARHLSRQRSAPSGARPLLRAALLVAPADPCKFGVMPLMPSEPLPLHSTVIGSETDPWMTGRDARHWAGLWGARFISLGDAGHINTEAGFGPLPKAKAIVCEMARRLAGELRIEATAHPAEWMPALRFFDDESNST